MAHIFPITITLFVLLRLVFSQQSQSLQQTHHGSNLPIPPTLAPVFSHPNSQIVPHLNADQQRPNSNRPPQYSLESNNKPGTDQPAPAAAPSPFRQYNPAAAAYSRDVYGTTRDASGNPIFGLSSNADFQLSAYFGQIFWSAVALVTTIVASVYIIKFFSGFNVIEGIVNKIRGSGPLGKALNLEHLTDMVYQALDTYGKFSDAREGRSESGEKKQ